MDPVSRQISCLWRDLASSQSFLSILHLPAPVLPIYLNCRGKEKGRSYVSTPQSPIPAIPDIGANES